MKKIMLTVTVLLSPLMAVAAPQTCAEKQNSLEQELSYARQANQTYRIQGLETALKKLKANCNDAQLISDYQEKIAEKQKKLSKAEAELQEVIREGKSEKKIQNKRDKVMHAKKALEQARSDTSD